MFYMLAFLTTVSLLVFSWFLVTHLFNGVLVCFQGRRFDLYLRVSGTYTIFIKIGTLPGDIVDFVFESHAASNIQLTQLQGLIRGTVIMNEPIYAIDCTTDINLKFKTTLSLTTMQCLLLRNMLKNDIIRYSLVGYTLGEPAYILSLRQKA